MKINESIIVITIIIILYIIYANSKNKKYNKHVNYNNNIEDDIKTDEVYYRNSHSVYRKDDYRNKNKENEYKKYRYNINNYTIKKHLLKNSEIEFYNILKKSIDSKYIICPKVKISNFIGMIDNRSWEYYYDKINYQSIDFLICDELFKPVFGIISFYGNPDAKTENEKALIEIYKIIKFPILQLKIPDIYSVDIIKDKINDLLNNQKTEASE